MPEIIKKGKNVFWVDGEGNEIPKTRIRKDEIKREAVIEKSFKKIIKLHESMKKVKAEVFQIVHDYLEFAAEQYGEKWAGNATLYTFKGDMAIEIKMAKTMTFDHKLQIAKTKIDKCIARWTENSDDNIKLIVMDAFKVNSKKQLDTKAILNLRKYKMKDPSGEWLEAMELISDAITIQHTREYITFRQKDEAGEWKNISLQFSAL